MRERPVNSGYTMGAPDAFRRCAWLAIIRGMGERTVLVKQMQIRTWRKRRNGVPGRDAMYQTFDVRGVTIRPGSVAATVTFDDRSRRTIYLRPGVYFWTPGGMSPRTFRNRQDLFDTDKPGPGDTCGTKPYEQWSALADAQAQGR